MKEQLIKDYEWRGLQLVGMVEIREVFLENTNKKLPIDNTKACLRLYFDLAINIDTFLDNLE